MKTRVLDALFYWYDIEVALLPIKSRRRILVRSHTYMKVSVYTHHFEWFEKQKKNVLWIFSGHSRINLLSYEQIHCSLLLYMYIIKW